MTTWIILIGAYLIGSVSSAIIACKLAGHADPREHGSHNPGATNVLRMGSKRLAIIVLLGDFCKGFIAVGLAKFFLPTPMLIGVTALAAVIGHIFPIFFSFKGGKGVATAAGAITAISYALGLCTLATWLSVVYLTGYSSLGAIMAAIMLPIFSLILAPSYFVILCVMSSLILLKHRENILRLIAGNESKSLKK